MTDILCTPDDLQWLRETQPQTQGKEFSAAILIGHEDSPTRIVLYKHNHYRSAGWVLDRLGVDANGNNVYKEVYADDLFRHAHDGRAPEDKING